MAKVNMDLRRGEPEERVTHPRDLYSIVGLLNYYPKLEQVLRQMDDGQRDQLLQQDNGNTEKLIGRIKRNFLKIEQILADKDRYNYSVENPAVIAQMRLLGFDPALRCEKTPLENMRDQVHKQSHSLLKNYE